MKTFLLIGFLKEGSCCALGIKPCASCMTKDFKVLFSMLAYYIVVMLNCLFQQYNKTILKAPIVGGEGRLCKRSVNAFALFESSKKGASGVFYLIGAVLSNILNVSAFAQLAIARIML